MAKLIFHYGVMSAGKSQELIQTNHNYQKLGRGTLLLKPTKDERDGAEFVVSKLGNRAPATPVSAEDNLRHIVEAELSEQSDIRVVLVDEAQFFSPLQIRQLTEVADDLEIPVHAYGLRNDSFGNLFPGSRTLFELADDLIELDKQLCFFCDRKAKMNMRFDNNGFVVREGGSIHIGENQYRSVCRRHWKLVEHIDDKFDEKFIES